MAVTATALSESYYPADQRERVLDTTVVGILRAAAQAVPDQIALIGGRCERFVAGDLRAV